MTTELLATLLSGILVIGGSAGFWQYRQSRKEAPVRKEEADVAVAEKSQQMALAIATRLDTDLIALKAELTTERGERQALGGRVDELAKQVREQARTITDLREVVRVFSTAWDDLIANWATLRQRDAPPAKPHTHNP